jgi:hypothetical protein
VYLSGRNIGAADEAARWCGTASRIGRYFLATACHARPPIKDFLPLNRFIAQPKLAAFSQT